MEPRKVYAVATAVHSHTDPDGAKRIEAAMVRAVEQALAEGITDPDVIRQRKLDVFQQLRS